MSVQAPRRGSASGERRRFPKLPPLDDRPIVGLRKTDQEIAERLAAALCAVSGKEKPDPRPIHGGVEFYNVVRKEGSRTGQAHGYTSWKQIGPELYPDVVSREDAMRKHSAMKNAALRLEAAGVLRVREHKGDFGESRCLYWELIDEPINAAILGGVTSPCSSTGDPAWNGPAAAPCGVRVRHTPLQERHNGRTRIAPWKFRTGKGSISRLNLAFDGPARPPAPFFGSELLGTPVVLPPFVPQGGRTSVSTQGSEANRPRDNVSSYASVGTAQETRDEIARVRASVRAALDAPLNRAATKVALAALAAETSGAARQRVDAWAASEAARGQFLERLAGITYPTYFDVAMPFELLRGPSFPHATHRWREPIVRNARRYDRYALRLALEGQPPARPTAMAYVIDLARSDGGLSVTWASSYLRRESLRLRAQWRELHPAREDEKARRRRARRVRRHAQNLARDGIRYRTGGARPGWAIPERAAADIHRVAAEQIAGDLHRVLASA